jgi:hypothetical protein
MQDCGYVVRAELPTGSVLSTEGDFPQVKFSRILKLTLTSGWMGHRLLTTLYRLQRLFRG